MQTDMLGAFLGSTDGSLVDEVLKVGTTHARAASSDDARIDVNVELDLGHVVLEDLDPSANVRQANNDCSSAIFGTYRSTYRVCQSDRDE